MIDMAWDQVIVPMLKARFGNADAAAVKSARACGRRLGHARHAATRSAAVFFTNLLHYTRSGDSSRR
jgi:hypothetical protein